MTRTTIREILDEVAQDPHHMSFADWHLKKLDRVESHSAAAVLMDLLNRVRWLEEENEHLNADVKKAEWESVYGHCHHTHPEHT